MMSMDAFIERCEAAIREGAPFIAYRHNHGHFWLYYERMLDVWDNRAKEWRPKLHKAKKGTISGLRKEIKRMQRDPRITGLLVVDYDGNTLTAQGGEELGVLYEVYLQRETAP